MDKLNTVKGYNECIGVWSCWILLILQIFKLEYPSLNVYPIMWALGGIVIYIFIQCLLIESEDIRRVRDDR
jgi:hypothetical protein